MAQLLQCFGFDLPDAFARDAEAAADFFERVLLTAAVEAKAHPDDTLLTRAERVQHLVRDFPQIHDIKPLRRSQSRGVFDQIAELRVALLTHWSFERDWLARGFERLTNFLRWHFHPPGDL